MPPDHSRCRIVVVTSTGLSDAWVEEIRAAAPEADIVTCADTAAAIHDVIPGAAALVACPRHVFSDAVLAHAGPSLRWVHASGAGCEEFITPGLVASPIVLTNGRIIQGPEVADHAVALLLALARNLHLMLRNRPKHRQPRPIELRGKTALVLGIGGIGLLIAERLAAFGMRIVAVDPVLKPMVSFVESVHLPESLHDLLPRADAILNASPLTRSSERSLGATEFALMKPSSLFVNVSRGKIVDTDALAGALAAGCPAAAGLDVTEPEPLPEAHALLTMDNVIVTHHTAGLSDHNRQRSQQLIATNIRRFARGQSLLNVVDKQLGF